MTASVLEMASTETHTLPDSWRWIRLGDLCEFTYGSGLPSYTRQNGIVPVYGSNGIVGFHNQALTAGPTIIIGRKGSIGEVHFSPIPCYPIDTTYYIERTKVEADLVWLTHWLKTLKLNELNKAAAIPGLNREDVYSLEIPLPPLKEQTRIATILNEQMAAVEPVRAAAEAQLEAAQALPAAYLRAIFNGAEAQQWPKQPLGDVAEIASGITLGRKLRGGKMQVVPYLRVANVKDGYLDLSDVYQIEATETEIEKLQLRYGDILLTEGGDPDKLGRGTFWEEQLPDCIHQNHIFRVRFDQEQFYPPFISAQIGSAYGKAYFLAHAKQTTGIATINQKVLAGFPLMSPPFEQQKGIAESLNNQFALAARMLQSLQDQLTTIRNLPAVLLRRAFNGEL